jgi:ribosome-binding factor A
MQRVSSLVKREVGAIVQELNLENCGFITVTDADISPDLREGHIYISVIGSPDQQRRAVEKLTSQHAVVQRELAHRVVLKYTPHLRFTLDQTEAHAREIEHLLDELNTDKPGDTP